MRNNTTTPTAIADTFGTNPRNVKVEDEWARRARTAVIDEPVHDRAVYDVNHRCPAGYPKDWA